VLPCCLGNWFCEEFVAQTILLQHVSLPSRDAFLLCMFYSKPIRHWLLVSYLKCCQFTETTSNGVLVWMGDFWYYVIHRVTLWCHNIATGINNMKATFSWNFFFWRVSVRFRCLLLGFFCFCCFHTMQIMSLRLIGHKSVHIYCCINSSRLKNLC